MNKATIYHHVMRELKTRYEIALTNAKSAREDATHEQSRAETQYDTLGLESAYLAEGQARRVEQCQADIRAFEELGCTKMERVGIGALVEVCDAQELCYSYLISPAAGGLVVEVDETKVTLLTPQAPLGRALMGRLLDDEVSCRVGENQLNFEITHIE